MHPSVCGIINDVVGVYYVVGVGKSYEVYEGVQHLLLVITSILYTVAIFGRDWLTV